MAWERYPINGVGFKMNVLNSNVTYIGCVSLCVCLIWPSLFFWCSTTIIIQYCLLFSLLFLQIFLLDYCDIFVCKKNAAVTQEETTNIDLNSLERIRKNHQNPLQSFILFFIVLSFGFVRVFFPIFFSFLLHLFSSSSNIIAHWVELKVSKLF